MIPLRLIARLDIKGPNIVKGVRMDGLRIIGNPGEIARKYYAAGIDEIVYIDTVASLYGRSNILPIVEETARDIFVPLTVGGGLRTIDDVTAALRSGADKVAINTAAVRRPEFIREVAEMFGAQCFVLNIEAKKMADGHWEAYVDNGRERTGVDAVAWAAEAESLGAGEILVTAVDRDGTKKGFDNELLGAIHRKVQIPVIASGGCGSAGDVVDQMQRKVSDAVACASVLHYGIETVESIKQAVQGAGFEVRQ
jgi:cyclase